MSRYVNYNTYWPTSFTTNSFTMPSWILPGRKNAPTNTNDLSKIALYRISRTFNPRNLERHWDPL